MIGYAVGVVLLFAAALMLLTGLALVVMSGRPRTTRVEDSIELPELLEPRTTAIPLIGGSTRHPGALFIPYDGPTGVDPEETD